MGQAAAPCRVEALGFRDLLLREVPVHVLWHVLAALRVHRVHEDVEVVGAEQDPVLVLQVPCAREGHAVHFRFGALPKKEKGFPNSMALGGKIVSRKSQEENVALPESLFAGISDNLSPDARGRSFFTSLQLLRAALDNSRKLFQDKLE